MARSNREKGLFYGTLGVAVLFLIDQYALTPLLNQQDFLQSQREKIQVEIDRNQKMFMERKQLAPKWNSMLKTSLKQDPAEAEGELLHALRDWAKDTNLTLSSVKPERPETKEPLKEVHVEASGIGSMDAIAKFLWKMQSSAFPLKITEFQLGSRNNGTSDLAVQVKISTLYYAPDAKLAKAEKPAAGGAK